MYICSDGYFFLVCLFMFRLLVVYALMVWAKPNFCGIFYHHGVVVFGSRSSVMACEI
jgi:hypothetical protein